ncbi:hypothetical protein HPB50_007703 [Hyalomma asiaticum]|uniref:Uncharacterized protein n=1 Tax=Hyalomma asiaticum TaxID=266040 RepID=A0ACB7TGK8_HYAAI|nr:hypothetical protein HPB50_007703 [Hyalomma asiaticum]
MRFFYEVPASERAKPFVPETEPKWDTRPCQSTNRWQPAVAPMFSTTLRFKPTGDGVIITRLVQMGARASTGARARGVPAHDNITRACDQVGVRHTFFKKSDKESNADDQAQVPDHESRAVQPPAM